MEVKVKTVYVVDVHDHLGINFDLRKKLAKSCGGQYIPKSFNGTQKKSIVNAGFVFTDQESAEKFIVKLKETANA